jgi:hypothetical protein
MGQQGHQDCVIRPAVSSDAAAVTALVNAACRHYFQWQ